MTDAQGEPRASIATDSARAVGSASVAALWLETLHAIANAVAHDLRNAFNAVAVNLEVVRGRSARGAEASAIAPFAATAATNFEVAAAAAEALLGFARPETGRADVALLTTRLGRLLSVSGHSRITVTDQSGGRALTSAPWEIVRVAMARSVLTALDTGDGIACEIGVDDGIFLRVIGVERVPPLPDPHVLTVAAASGIHFAQRERSLEVRFP